jgi:hypothetical protein
MNATNEPATEQQISFLNHCGCAVDSALTRSDAANLIKQVRERAGQGVGVAAQSAGQSASRGGYYLGKVLEEGNLAVADQGSALPPRTAGSALERRREFWLDTCREMTEMHSASPQVMELYQKHGCRFAVPTHEEVQEVLDALDSALKNWEQEHPELFFQTLELNFPELVKHCR